MKSSHTFRLHPRGKVSIKLLSLAAVSILLLTVLAPMLFTDSEVSADYQRSVTYYPSQEDYDNRTNGVTIQYSGLAYAAYNPQYDESFKGKAGWEADNVESEGRISLDVKLWTEYRTTHVTVSLTDSITITDVSDKEENWSGVQYVEPSISENGDSLFIEAVGITGNSFNIWFNFKYSGPSVFAGWQTDNGVSKDPGDILNTDVLIAKWTAPEIYLDIDDHEIHTNDETWNVRPYKTLSYGGNPVPSDIHNNDGSDPKYTDITNVDTDFSGDFTSLASGTYRSVGSQIHTSKIVNNVNLNGHVIIDNLNLYADKQGSNHGDGGVGIFANGYKLIIGTGMGLGGTNLEPRQAPQLYGGTNGSNIGGTDVAIFSGVYYNVIAGSTGGTITGNTRVVLAGGVVLDTLAGGNAGSQNGLITGDAYVYVLGDAFMPGDYYEEKYLGYGEELAERLKGIDLSQLVESSILTGGSTQGDINGNTYVYISNEATLWDVQGGGRRAASTHVGTANVEVSGEALVKHLVCGSITDGNNTISPTKSVKNVTITVKDGASVGSVFGAGYDTYYQASQPSMYDGGTIEVNIQGQCKVGYVYGGGYRGTIGTEDQPIGSIKINISGGTVLHDVFGGGRGGVDKILHDSDGCPTNIYWNTESDYGSDEDSMSDTTGHSEVFVNSLSINITGGEVRGNVYGGGESVPTIAGSYTLGNSNTIDFMGNDEVASTTVTGSISISITGGSVDGSVYGAGKGIGDTSTINGPSIDVLKSRESEGLTNIPWFTKEGDGGSDGQNFGFTYSDADYSRYAHVKSESTNIMLDGYRSLDNEAGGDAIYGGGMYGNAEVTGTISISVSNSTVIGSIFGGGMGDPDDSSVAKVTADTIAITLDKGTQLGDYEEGSGFYAVFGGGAAAYVDVDTVRITLGGGVVIDGDVYGGGYGTVLGHEEPSESKPIMSNDRKGSILLNGATVNGNIYGGGRAGNDQLDKSNETVLGDIYIYLESGVVMQGVYGGGFMGKTYMNSHILVGSSAVSVTGIMPYSVSASPDLRINNIYGGGYLNAPGEEAYAPGSELLMGNAEISISGGPVSSVSFGGYAMPGKGEESNVPKLSIYGDIFGEGNYSAICGTASIEIFDYNQNNTYHIHSIQRADSLTISDSDIAIEGAAKGTTTGMSVLVSLNHLGTLSLEGGVNLEIHSETSAIGEYYSKVGDSLATESLYMGDERDRGNRIVLHEGRLLRVLGANDTGKDGDDNVGIIHGYTILSRDEGETYYGAFAIGSIDTDEESGFMVETSDGMKAASYVPSSSTKTWYIAGHVSIGSILTFEESGYWKAAVNMELPHLSSESMLAYSSAYVEPTVQNGIYILTNQGADGTHPGYPAYIAKDGFDVYEDIGNRDFFTMTVSGSGSDTERKQVNVKSHIVSGSNLERFYFDGDGYEATGNIGDFNITIDSKFVSNEYYGLYPEAGSAQAVILGTSGIVGTVTIHLAEVIEYTIGTETKYMPLNMINIDVTLNVKPKGDIQYMSITVMTAMTSGRYVGTGYILLPSLGSKHSYRLSGASGDASGKTSFVADSTYLSYQGWISSNYISNGLSGDDIPADSASVLFGEGGVKDTVIRVTYSDPDEPAGSMSFNITASDASGEDVTYVVNVTFMKSEPVELILGYESLVRGEDNTPLMYGLTVDGSGTETDPYRASWSEDGTGSLTIQYGAVLNSETVYYVADGVTVKGSIIQMMDWLLTTIDDYEYERDGETHSFVYSENLDGWYINGTEKYDPSSKLKESLSLTARFGIEVRFHGEFVSVYPQSVIIRPNTSLHENGIGNPGEDYPVIPWTWNTGDPVDGIRPGYHIHIADGSTHPQWVISTDTMTAWNFDNPVFQAMDLYIPWAPNEYSLSLTVEGGDPGTILSSSLGQLGWNQEEGAWNTEVTVVYGQTVTFSVKNDSFKISEATGTYGDGSVLGVDGVPGSSIGFMVPNAGFNDVGRISLEITLVEGHTLTIQFAGETSLSNGLDQPATLNVGPSSQEFKGNAPMDWSLVVDGGEVRVQVTLPQGYLFAMWKVDGQSETLLTDRNPNGGRVGSGAVTIDVSDDTTLRFMVYRQVLLDDVGAGIGSVTATPVDCEGVAGSPISINEGQILFKGYVLTVVPQTNYTLPFTQTGTGSGSVSGQGLEYTVLGTVDVILVATVDSYNFTLTVTFRDNSGQVLDDRSMSELYGTYLEYKFDSSEPARVPIGSDTVANGVMVISRSIAASDLPVYVTVSVPGFSSATGYPAVSGDDVSVSVDIRLTEYTVRYFSLDGDTLFGESVWTVLSSNVPNYSTADVTVSEGRQVWMVGSQSGYAVLDLISTDRFDNGILVLYAMPVFDGGLAEHDMVTVVATEGQLEEGLAISLDLDDFTVIMPGEGGTKVSYSSGVLTVGPVSGTGSVTLTIGATLLKIVSLPEADVGGVVVS